MTNLRQVFLGIVIALASIGLLLGAFSLSLAEGNSIATSTSVATPTPTLTPTSSPTWQPITPSAFISPSLDSPTPFPTWTPTLTPTLTPSLTLTPTLPLTPTLTPLSANYLLTTELIPSVVVFVPPMRTQIPLSCGAPYSWIVYFVQPGDTLYHLGLAYGISISELQRANCMRTSTLLRTGQMLNVPPWAPLAPLQTVPIEVISTCILTGTPVPCSCSDTPTELPINTATEIPTPTEVLTATLVPTTP